MRVASLHAPLQISQEEQTGHEDTCEYEERVSSAWLKLQNLLVSESESNERVQENGLVLYDELYHLYVSRNGPVPEGDPAYRARLLRAFRESDVEWLEAELESAQPGKWDFVFPPVSRLRDGSRDFAAEGWCRSPFSLLSRMQCDCVGVLGFKAVETEVRLSLVRKAVQTKVATPDFLSTYWACPAMQAALAGDLEVLKLLHHDAGMNLREVACEWLMQRKACFTLAHAAAFNGQTAVLEWLRTTYWNPSATEAELGRYFAQPNGVDSTPLDIVLRVSNSLPCANLLLRYGADPFRIHPLTGLSPLCLALEKEPEFAESILTDRAINYNLFFGNSLLERNYFGLVLPNTGPQGLQFKTADGSDKLSIEELILDSGRQSLVDVPIVMRLMDEKWEAFASDWYKGLLAEYVLLYIVVFILAVATFTEQASFLQTYGTKTASCCIFFWCLYARRNWAEFTSTGAGNFFGVGPGANIVDVAILGYVPLTVLAHVLVSFKSAALPAPVAATDAVLQIFMSWRLALWVSALDSNGVARFLSVVTRLLAALVEPLGFLVVSLLIFANAFIIVSNFGSTKDPRTYAGLLWEEAKLVFKGLEGVDESSAIFTGLPLQYLGDALLAVFTAVVLLGTFGLFQNTTEKLVWDSASSNAGTQFRWTRLRLIASIEREMQAVRKGRRRLERFYAQLADQAPVARMSKPGPTLLREGRKSSAQRI